MTILRITDSCFILRKEKNNAHLLLYEVVNNTLMKILAI